MASRTMLYDIEDASVRIFNWRNLRHIDWFLPLVVIILAVIGWATMYSAVRSSDIVYFRRQIMFFFIGVAIALTLACIDYRVLISLAPLMYVGSVVLLLAVLFLGTRVKGSERWLVMGPFRVQPSEITKLVMVFSLTWYLVAIGERVRKLPYFLLAFVITGVPILLILAQPNLGTALSLAPLTLAMLFVAGCRIRHLAVIFLLGVSGVPLLWWQMKDFDPELDRPQAVASSDSAVESQPARRSFFELRYHQKKRIYTFLHPEADIRDSGWHTYQSKITIGSGGMSGKGYLQGTQTRLNYLPEHRTDFIFSLLAEEHGFVGAMVLLGLFAALLLRGLMYARDCPEMSGTLLATGVVTILGFHVFVNIAITTGLMPVTGLPLPFLSYGGSFYMTTMASIGVLLSIPIRRGMFIT